MVIIQFNEFITVRDNSKIANYRQAQNKEYNYNETNVRESRFN
jgi:hypothetical protein